LTSGPTSVAAEAAEQVVVVGEERQLPAGGRDRRVHERDVPDGPDPLVVLHEPREGFRLGLDEHAPPPVLDHVRPHRIGRDTVAGPDRDEKESRCRGRGVREQNVAKDVQRHGDFAPLRDLIAQGPREVLEGYLEELLHGTSG
jgi:hypothetical protein